MKKIETLNQTKLAYQDEGHGSPVILIHGLDGNSAAFDLLNKQLQQNYRVIVYDVRGHGKSSRPDSYNLEEHVKDLAVLAPLHNGCLLYTSDAADDSTEV